MGEETKKDELHSALEQLGRSTYFNGYHLTVSASDVAMVLTHNGEPILILNTNHIIGKAMAKGLKDVVDKFEGQVSISIPDYFDIVKKIESNESNKK